MRNQGIRNEMLKCAFKCRVNIMPIGNLVSLSWTSGTGAHREIIRADSLVLCSMALVNALDNAKLALNQ